MVREIDRRGFVGGSPIVEPEFVIIGQGVSNQDREVAGITFLTVFAKVGELHGGFGPAGRQRFSFPEHLRKSFVSTMNVVGTAIGRQLIFLAVQDKPGFGDPVGHPPDNGCGRRMSLQIGGQIVRTQNDVSKNAVAVWRAQFRENSAIRHDFRHQAVTVP